MYIGLSLLSGQELHLVPGIPDSFQGTLLGGANALHASASFGTVVVQQVQMSAMDMVLVSLHWKKPERLICEYDHQCTMFTRTMLTSNLHHYIKGTGEIHLRKEQFMTLAAGAWRSVILPERRGYHAFVDISWSPSFVEDIIKADHELYGKVKTMNCEGFPETMFGVPFHMSPAMKRSVLDVEQINFSEVNAERMIRPFLRQYFSAMVAEAVERYSIRKKMREADWLLVNAAKQLIDADLHQQYSTPEISQKVGLNEYKLKKLFPHIAGKKIDEYRKYQLCINAGKKIVERKDEPLKNFYADAGYTSLTTFIRGFKKLCCCTPGELRDGTWDLASINTGGNG